MAMFREILIGQSAVAELMGDRDVLVLHPGHSSPKRPYSVACMVLGIGVNVCAYERFGFSLLDWSEDGYQIVKWPVSPLAEDYAEFQRATAEALLPVVDSALAAVAEAKASLGTGVSQ